MLYDEKRLLFKVLLEWPCYELCPNICYVHVVPIYIQVVPLYVHIVPIYVHIVPLYVQLVPIFVQLIPKNVYIVPISVIQLINLRNYIKWHNEHWTQQLCSVNRPILPNQWFIKYLGILSIAIKSFSYFRIFLLSLYMYSLSRIHVQVVQVVPLYGT